MEILVDLGSGLGYLVELLCRKCPKKYHILALEADEHRVQTAAQRLRQQLPTDTAFVKFKQEFVTPQSQPMIELEISQLLKNPYVECQKLIYNRRRDEMC